MKQGNWHKEEARLPKLRTIRLEHDRDMDADRFEKGRDDLLEIVSRAPNLQDVQSRFSLDCIESLPLEKMHNLDNIMFPRSQQWDEEAKVGLLWDKFRESEPMLHAIKLYDCPPLPFGRFTKGRYVDGLVYIIRSSSESLRAMELDYGATLDLEAISDRLPPLSNETKSEYFQSGGGLYSS